MEPKGKGRVLPAPLRLLLLCPGRVSILEVLWVGIEPGLAVSHSGLKFVRKLWKRQIVGDVVLFFPSVDAPAKYKDDEKLLGSPPIDAGRRGDLEQTSFATRARRMKERGVRKHTREELRLRVLHVDLN